MALSKGGAGPKGISPLEASRIYKLNARRNRSPLPADKYILGRLSATNVGNSIMSEGPKAVESHKVRQACSEVVATSLNSGSFFSKPFKLPHTAHNRKVKSRNLPAQSNPSSLTVVSASQTDALRNNPLRRLAAITVTGTRENKYFR